MMFPLASRWYDPRSMKSAIARASSIARASMTGICVLVGMASAISVAPALAQSSPQPTSVTPSVTPPESRRVPGGGYGGGLGNGYGAEVSGQPLVSLRFAGGSLREFIDQFEDEFANANLVISDEAYQRPVPRLDLKNVTPEDALRVVHAFDPLLHIKEVPLNRPSQEPALALVVTVVDQGSDEVTEILSIRELIHQIPLEQVLAGIEGAVDMSHASSRFRPPTVRVHQETGLLMVRGRPESLGVVRRIIEEIRAGVHVAQRQEGALKAQRANLEDAARELRNQEQRLRHQQDDFKSALAQLKRELAERDSHIAELQARLKQTMLDVERLRGASHTYDRSPFDRPRDRDYPSERDRDRRGPDPAPTRDSFPEPRSRPDPVPMRDSLEPQSRPDPEPANPPDASPRQPRR